MRSFCQEYIGAPYGSYILYTSYMHPATYNFPQLVLPSTSETHMDARDYEEGPIK